MRGTKPQDRLLIFSKLAELFIFTGVRLANGRVFLADFCKIKWELNSGALKVWLSSFNFTFQPCSSILHTVSSEFSRKKFSKPIWPLSKLVVTRCVAPYSSSQVVWLQVSEWRQIHSMAKAVAKRYRRNYRNFSAPFNSQQNFWVCTYT